MSAYFLDVVQERGLGWREMEVLGYPVQRGVAAWIKRRETRREGKEERVSWVCCSHQRFSFRALLGMPQTSKLPVLCLKEGDSSFWEHKKTG